MPLALASRARPASISTRSAESGAAGDQMQRGPIEAFFSETRRFLIRAQNYSEVRDE